MRSEAAEDSLYLSPPLFFVGCCKAAQGCRTHLSPIPRFQGVKDLSESGLQEAEDRLLLEEDVGAHCSHDKNQCIIHSQQRGGGRVKVKFLPLNASLAYFSGRRRRRRSGSPELLWRRSGEGERKKRSPSPSTLMTAWMA
jgi:hypothetical protein